MDQSLVVKLTSGQDDPERCVLGLTVAAAAVATGVTTALWLAGEAAWLAVPGRAAELIVSHAAPPEILLETVLEAGPVIVCTQCAQRRYIGASDLISGITIAGATAFVSAVMAPNARALVY